MLAPIIIYLFIIIIIIITSVVARVKSKESFKKRSWSAKGPGRRHSQTTSAARWRRISAERWRDKITLRSTEDESHARTCR